MALLRNATGAAIFSALAVLSTCAAANATSAYTSSTLYSFCSQANCSDGGEPVAGLIRDGAGNLYGTTSQTFSAGEGGTVFELSPNGDGTWTYHNLYSFCNGAVKHCEASYPIGDLIIDVDGNLYGTAERGNKDAGSVFELMPNADRTVWTFSVIHKFCASDCKHPDGAAPAAGLAYAGQASGLPYDGTSPLYGTTSKGGVSCCYGTVFELVREAGARPWHETILHEFCETEGCPDGSAPASDLIIDAAGNLYGTTTGGGLGLRPFGVVFELSPKGIGSWAEKVLYSFCSRRKDCLDGAQPGPKLLMDAGGNLFGTAGGGNPKCKINGSHGCGVLFKLSPDGGKWHEEVLHAFCTVSGCMDGNGPGGVSMDAAGNLFGTTFSAGQNGYGTAFEYSASGFQTIYQFCSLSFCADGASPTGGLLLDGSGNLFGVAYEYGKQGAFGTGSVFELSP